MATSKNNNFIVEAVRKTKVETTFEYVPIIGEILGYWRKVDSQRTGETIELHIRTSIGEYDRLLINGVQIPLTPTKIDKQ